MKICTTKIITPAALAMALSVGGAFAASDNATKNDTKMNESTSSSSQTSAQMSNGDSNNDGIGMEQFRSRLQRETSANAMSSEEMNMSQGNLIRAGDILDSAIYTTDAADDEGWDPNVMHEEVETGWNEIGNVHDIVLSQDGRMTGVVAEVGGLVDVGDKHVLISVKDVNLVSVGEDTYAYVTRFDEEELEAMKSVNEGFWN